jgi:hypothetical protein
MPENTMVPRRRVLIAPLALLLTFALSAVAHAASTPPKITKVQPLALEVGQKLTVRGKHFVPGKSRNTLVFKRDGKPAIFVKVTDRASSTKLTVIVPTKILDFMKDGDKLGSYRFRLRVLGKRFGDAFTATKLSPRISPPAAGVPGSPTASVSNDCDNDKVLNDADADDDNDKLPDTAETGLKTDPCKADSDGDGVSDAFEVESALDLNLRALPYPGKRPFPNALDGTDGGSDFDGDGLNLVEEYSLWLFTTQGNLPLTYSDGDKDTNVSGPSTPANGSPLDMDGDGFLGDDDKDADGDGLGNWDEWHGRSHPDWWAAAFEQEKAFSGRPGTQMMSPLNPMDPDIDGDGVVDGSDDQDHDDWTNVQERSRFDWPAASFAPLTGQPNLASKYLAVNPYNPCLPNRESRSCTEHPPFQEPWAPFDGSLGAPVLGFHLWTFTAP